MRLKRGSNEARQMLPAAAAAARRNGQSKKEAVQERAVVLAKECFAALMASEEGERLKLRRAAACAVLGPTGTATAAATATTRAPEQPESAFTASLPHARARRASW